MKNKRISLFCLLWPVLQSVGFSQSFEKTFSGQWATTSWTFEFHKDGTYKRTSTGHYGNPEYKGNYYIKGDTLQILTGYENSHGTVNEYYFLDGDSFLVDLHLMYDYQLNAKPWEHNSKKRYDVLPQPNMDSAIVIQEKTFINLVTRSSTLLSQTETSDIPDDQHLIIIRCYNTLALNKQKQLQSPYKELMDLIEKTNYIKEMGEYYDWIPNRGMGFYFQKLQVELGGTPHLWSRYQVIK